MIASYPRPIMVSFRRLKDLRFLIICTCVAAIIGIVNGNEIDADTDYCVNLVQSECKTRNLPKFKMFHMNSNCSQKKCHYLAYANDTSISWKDTFLFRTAYVENTKKLYLNIYCALCFGESEAKLGDVTFSMSGTNNSISYPKCIKDRAIDTSLLDDSVNRIKIYGLCTNCEDIDEDKCKSKKFYDGFELPHGDRDAFYRAVETYHQNTPTTSNLIKKVSRNCVYFDANGVQCQKSSSYYVEGVTFAYCDTDNKKIIKIEEYEGNESQSTITVKCDSISNTAEHFVWQDSEWIFQCLKNNSMKPNPEPAGWQKAINTMEYVGRYISMALLVVLLIVFWDKKFFVKVSNIVFYAYSSTVLVHYVYMELFEMQFNCFVKYLILIYFLLCDVIGLLIIILECWQIVYGSLRADESSSPRNTRLLKYIVYSVVGWILPAVIAIPCCLILSTDSPYDYSFECPAIPNYMEIKVSCPNYKENLAEFASYSAMVAGSLVFIPSLLFVCLVKFDQLRSTVKKDRLNILARTTYVIGAYWIPMMVLWAFQFDNEQIFHYSGRTLRSLYGISIFLCCGINKQMFIGMLVKCGLNVTIAEKRTEINLVQLTQQVIEPMMNEDDRTSQTTNQKPMEDDL